MKCIVTAGPAYEELDQVRRLTNFSTGALGTELASHLAASGHEVRLLRGAGSTSRAEFHGGITEAFTTAADLAARLEAQPRDGVGAVFHAAAVSDFGFGKIWRRNADGSLTEIQSRKIPTRGGGILAELTPTPKIIARLRAWFPSARIIGWKYEVEGSAAETVAAGARQIKENRTDYCVVNGPAYGDGFGLVAPDGSVKRLSGKEELFQALAAPL